MHANVTTCMHGMRRSVPVPITLLGWKKCDAAFGMPYARAMPPYVHGDACLRVDQACLARPHRLPRQAGAANQPPCGSCGMPALSQSPVGRRRRESARRGDGAASRVVEHGAHRAGASATGYAARRRVCRGDHQSGRSSDASVGADATPSRLGGPRSGLHVRRRPHQQAGQRGPLRHLHAAEYPARRCGRRAAR
eukprot:359985-Chlamydomonas_euryale.AAC.8